MKFEHLVGGLLLSCFCMSCQSENQKDTELSVRYATKSEAETLIVGADDFSENLNQFDLNVRLQKPGATKSEWEDLAKRETMEWSQEEVDRMEMAFDSIESKIGQMGLAIPFPKEIVMLKTSMNEELGAGAYTRENWIAIGSNELKLANDAQLTRLAAHELFHVLSRHDADFKQKVYRVFGFEQAPEDLVFAEDAQKKRITNPDIAERDSYIPLTIDGEVRNCVEYIYADHAYDGGDIFDCLRVGFIPLDEQMQPEVADTGTVIYPLAAVEEEFVAKIGKNTGYVIDPEEISAEHFSFLVTGMKNLPNPEFLDSLQQVLKAE